ncbi:MAG TPA: PilT/PilU family type 4a pilus ATPase [Gemmatimonadaceae bacterium]|nr:PilT/PilU family type 4a pilus ATPase [Gemmatimonadaceae bacterium]
MAQLDRLLAVMAADNTGVLTLDEGNPARIESAVDGASRPVTRAPLTGAQIVSLLREVAPPDSAVQLDRGAPAAFTYVCDGGAFDARAELEDGRWRVRIGAATPVAPPPLVLVDDELPESCEPGDALVLSDLGAADSARSPALDRIDALLRVTVSRAASDLHLRCGEPPILRCHGEIIRLAEHAPLRADDVLPLVEAAMPATNRAEFAATSDTDFAYEIPGCARFRVNAFKDRFGVAAVFRRIPPAVVTVEELGLPPEVQRLCALTRGLVLVTGPTGSGKSTTLCSLIDLVNRTRSDHIITIEDPIEFVHQSQRCIVSQRQVGMHTRSFKSALRAALREDPDVVLIGEMRDLETVSIALETAETGHLVFATLHTTTAATTIDRIIDQFPADQQEQIRVMLADSLRGVISQTLCKRIGGGRVAAREILFNTPPIANLIRERKAFQIPAIVQTSKRMGMATLNDALIELVERREVELEEAYTHATDKANFIGALRAKGIDAGALDEHGGLRPSGRVSGAVRVG